MGAKASGSVFWALMLFPVAAELLSPRCVTYKRRELCGLQGSSVEFPCSYPKNSTVSMIAGWSKNLQPNMTSELLKLMPAYSSRIKYLGRGNNDCTMKLADLKTNDASIYYFTYSFINATGYRMTCKGVPGVRLHVFVSPVSILVWELVSGQNVPVADCTVKEGQRIKLTCVPTCAANLYSNPGYIWYKNRLQLNDSGTNLPFLLLDPISNEDAGSYVCAMIGYKRLPSPALNLRVERKPRNTEVSDEIPGGGSKKDSVPTSTHGFDGQNSTDQWQEPKNKSIFRFSTTLITSASVGFVFAMMVVLLVHKVKKMKGRRCAGSVRRPPESNNDIYMATNINTLSAEYDTLDTVTSCSAADVVYENFIQPGMFMDERGVFKLPTDRFTD